jgi:hypothetical protein
MKQSQSTDGRYGRFRAAIERSSTYSAWRAAEDTDPASPFALAISAHSTSPDRRLGGSVQPSD